MTTGTYLGEIPLATHRHRMRELITLARMHTKVPFASAVWTPSTQESADAISYAYGSGTPWSPFKHSELIAMEAAAERCGHLHGLILYTTHEPCMLCCGGIIHSKVSMVVFGSYRADQPDLFRVRKYDVLDLLGDTTTPPVILGGVERGDCTRLFDGIESLA
jgi:tRNA(Arg) A34 adenosine deaminase TadA